MKYLFEFYFTCLILIAESHTLATLSPIKTHNSSKEMCQLLPHRCHYINYRRQKGRHEGILCENELFTNQAATQSFVDAWNGCPALQQSGIDLALKQSSSKLQQQIINSRKYAHLFALVNYLPDLQFKFNFRFIGVVKGFDIESQISLKNIAHMRFFTDFNLYKQERLVRDCHDFLDSKSRGFIFQHQDIIDFNLTIFIIKPKSVHPICSLFFANANMGRLFLTAMAKSYFLNNLVSFTNPTWTLEDKGLNFTSLNATIIEFYVTKSYGLDLDATFLNSHIFARTQSFGFGYHVNSIEPNVFAPFTPHLSQLWFDPLDLIRVCRKQGIDWMRAINRDVNVDVSNETDLSNNEIRAVFILFSFNRDFILGGRNFALDADFCLFVGFPFRQMVLISEDVAYAEMRPTSFSCTELWLNRFYQHFFEPQDYLFRKLNSSNFSACDFHHRVDSCNKVSFPRTTNTTKQTPKWSSFDSMLILGLIQLVVSVVASTYAIVTNLLVVYVIYAKENAKITRDKHYTYMSLHSACNAVIGSIQLVELMSECEYPFGLFCSTVRVSRGVQYTRIVFGEYFNSLFRLLSNFTYFGFAMCRMFRVGKVHGRLTTFVANDLSIRKYMLTCAIASAGLSACKAMQFDINVDMPDYAYPVPFVQNVNRHWTLESGYVSITVINAVYDAINYLVFVVVHFGVDLVLVKKMRRVIGEKEGKLVEMLIKGTDLERASNEAKASKRRVVVMVVLGSLFNVATKVPSMVTSLNDVRLIILKPVTKRDDVWFSFDPVGAHLDFGYFCSSVKGCLEFQRFGNCLFLVSLCSTIHFLKCFDKNFELGLAQVIGKKSITNNN